MSNQHHEVHGLLKVTVPVGEGRNVTYVGIEAGLNKVTKENTEGSVKEAFEEVWTEVAEQIEAQIETRVASILKQISEAKGEG